MFNRNHGGVRIQMTSEIYSSKTGLYTIRFKSDIIHEGLDHTECSELMDYYRERYKNLKDSGWPLEPEYMHIEEFSGTLVLSKKK